MPWAASRPAHRSATGMPTRTALARQAGHRHQAAHALRDLIEARPLGIRPVLAEAGDAGEHDARIDRPEVVVGDVEPSLTSGRKFSTTTSARSTRRSRISRPSAALRFRVRLRLLRCRFWKSDPARAAEPMAVGPLVRHLDLDHVGAPVGELAHAGRSGAHPRQIDHREAGQGGTCGQMRHGALPGCRRSRLDSGHHTGQGPCHPSDQPNAVALAKSRREPWGVQQAIRLVKQLCPRRAARPGRCLLRLRPWASPGDGSARDNRRLAAPRAS